MFLGVEIVSEKNIDEAQGYLFSPAIPSGPIRRLLQAMDTGGKDGTIRAVFQGVNPQGVQVFSFKQPSTEELDHNWLWRYWRNV